MKMRSQATTTAEFADLPTPSVPFFEKYPLKQPTNPMANPKKKDLINDGITSEYSRDSNTW